MALIYGCVHVINPDLLALSWGVENKTWDPKTADFAKLLGVWILFQAWIAAIVPLYIKDLEGRYAITCAHVFKNTFAFVLRCAMWSSGRYNPITIGFVLSAFADLVFSVGYGYFLIFPEMEKSTTRNSKNK